MSLARYVLALGFLSFALAVMQFVNVDAFLHGTVGLRYGLGR